MRLTEVIAPAQAFNAALGVNDPLFARIEGMAFAAQLNSDGRFGATGLENISAGTRYR